MRASRVERWCKKNSWTEPRRLDVGIWVAFPPGGVIETPLPLQVQKPKTKVLQSIIDTILLVLITAAMLAIVILMSPCFLQPLINRHRRQSK